MVSPTLAAVERSRPDKLELARQSYALWNASGVDAVLERFWAPDIVFHDLPQAPDTGIFRGAEEVVARLRTVMQSWDRLPQFEVRSLEQGGNYTLAIVELRVEGQGSGVALAAQAAGREEVPACREAQYWRVPSPGRSWAPLRFRQWRGQRLDRWGSRR